MFEPLSALIRLQREAQDLTIDELSRLAGVSRTRLISLENGVDNISLELLVKIANALQMTEIRIVKTARWIESSGDLRSLSAGEARRPLRLDDEEGVPQAIKWLRELR